MRYFLYDNPLSILHVVSKISKATGYDKISLPTEMIDEIKALIEANPEFGFKSPPEFIREAIRNRIAYYKSLAEKVKV